MNLADYLQRIDYHGSLHPTLATLRSLHRAHLFAVPYENFDIHLGRRLTLDVEQIFAKIVWARRGGWCYEMNGLFAWVLREIGFQVDLLAAAVNRHRQGDGAEDGHLLLLVHLDQPYVVDVGFGDAMLEPLPLHPGEYQQRGLIYRLSQEAGRWIFHNHQYSGSQIFDFTLQPRSLNHFAAKCDEQQTAPTSGFVQKTVCHCFTPDSILSLRGAVLREVKAQGIDEHIIENNSDYANVLRQRFHLCLADTEWLWATIWERHLAWIDAQPRVADEKHRQFSRIERDSSTADGTD
jgi:N-hydroxyarylamine O-acetyltransferase